MTARPAYKKIVILGSGGLRIGQAGEFDYSGSQAIKALKEEGIYVVLVNPNIATVQTDRGMADRVYFQPLNVRTVTRILEQEKPDGVMLSFGGQTALNLGLNLHDQGVFRRLGIKVLGTPVSAIKVTEDRDLFKKSLAKIKVKTARSLIAYNIKEALAAAKTIGYPVMLRSGYSLGGLGSGRIDNEAYFKGIAFKWSDGGREDFPKLTVKVRPEIVTFNAADEIKVDDKGIVGGGKRLKPEQIHKLLAERGDEVVFFDGRNVHEAAVGRFKNAVVPQVEHTRDFTAELSNPKYEAIKDKPVVTYCTGGIRCEVLSMLMKKRGFKEVYQLDGGIVKYGEAYGDEGQWEGALYVFDGRVTTKFSNKAKDIGECVHCGAKTSNYANCADKTCNKLILICKNCTSKTQLCAKHGEIRLQS